MPDRSSAPAVQQIKQVSIPEAVTIELDNGIPLHYIDAGQQPVLRLEIVFNAGKWFEDLPGQSYFTGKMLTEGTKSYSAHEIATRFDQLGVFVEVNSDFDHITLVVHLLARQLDEILPLLYEMVYNPAFRDSELQDLKDRKKQSLLVNLQKNSFVAARQFSEVVFGGDHPYGRVLTIEDIERTEQEKVAAFHGKRFGGSFEIILSGMVRDKHLEALNRVMGQASYIANEPRTVGHQQYKASNNRVEKEESLQSSIRLGMPFIHRQHPDYLEMLVVNEILGGYFGSRLMSNIREDKGYTYGIRSGIRNLMHQSIWVVSTDVKKEFAEHTLTEISKEIKRLQTELVSSTELETVKNYMLGSLIGSLDTPFALADRFKTVHYSGLDYRYYTQYYDIVTGIEGERIMQLSRQYLRPENMSSVVVG